MQEIRFDSWVGKIPLRRDRLPITVFMGFPGGSDGKNKTKQNKKKPTCNVGDLGLITALGRSPGGGHDNHSSILAWRSPWIEEPRGLQSMGFQRVGHDWATKHSTAQHSVRAKKPLGWELRVVWSRVGDGEEGNILRCSGKPTYSQHKWHQTSLLCWWYCLVMGFPDVLVGKESTCNAGDAGDTDSVPGLQRSPGGGNGNPLKCAYLQKPYGQQSLAGYNPKSCKESDTTE